MTLRSARLVAAGEHYRKALALARSPTERRFFETRAVRTLRVES